MRIFISGGCKNGKSFYAQHLAKAQSSPNSKLYYIATMLPTDHEDHTRIEKHRNERDGWDFITVEQPTNIEAILTRCDSNASFLLDSITALLANEMFPFDAPFNPAAPDSIAASLSHILSHTDNIVLVSDYIYSDALIYDPLTDDYRKALAYIDRSLAASCDVVLEVVFSALTVHKGDAIFERLHQQICGGC